MLDFLDRKIGRFAISNLTLYLIIGQVFVTLTAMLQLLDPTRLVLYPQLATHGEPWRLFTFMFLPPPVGGRISLMLLPFAWWLFFLMGNALEGFWGVFRYNAFLFTGFALTVAGAFLNPFAPTTNYHLMLGVALVFAWLNPDFEINLFFILPVKMKWLALLSVAAMIYDLVTGAPSTRWQIAATGVTLALFIGSDVLNTIRFRRRTMAMQAQRRAEEKKGPEPRHRCHVCGKTDLTNPEMDFRYCSKCAGDQCYCPEHIFNHEHVLTDGEEKKP